VLEKHFIYAVEDVEEELIMFQKSDVQPAGMEKHPKLKLILGELKIFTEKELVKFLIEKTGSNSYQF
jgi:ferredoxin-fold anticodon binding domain-containing protein